MVAFPGLGYLVEYAQQNQGKAGKRFINAVSVSMDQFCFYFVTFIAGF